MKKIYFLVFAFCFFNGLKAQIINIPDANFKAKLLEADIDNFIANTDYGTPLKIDLNDDGEIEVSEILNVKELHLNKSEISNLSGIENFANLTRLECSYNKLTNLDLSSLPLLYIDCNDNILTSLILGSRNVRVNCYDNKLTSLNVSGLNNLTYLDCSENK